MVDETVIRITVFAEMALERCKTPPPQPRRPLASAWNGNRRGFHAPGALSRAFRRQDI